MQILSVPHAGAILANYLVVAGGASGANRVGGGGGAGLDNGDTATFLGGAGGSGIVIVDAGITAASTTGSPTLSGTKYTFTGSGSITF